MPTIFTENLQLVSLNIPNRRTYWTQQTLRILAIAIIMRMNEFHRNILTFLARFSKVFFFQWKAIRNYLHDCENLFSKKNNQSKIEGSLLADYALDYGSSYAREHTPFDLKQNGKEIGQPIAQFCLFPETRFCGRKIAHRESLKLFSDVTVT